MLFVKIWNFITKKIKQTSSWIIQGIDYVLLIERSNHMAASPYIYRFLKKYNFKIQSQICYSEYITEFKYYAYRKYCRIPFFSNETFLHQILFS